MTDLSLSLKRTLKISSIESGALTDKISRLTISFSRRPSENKLLTKRVLKSLSFLVRFVLHKLSVMCKSLK